MKKINILTLLTVVVLTVMVQAQNLKLPRESQAAEISQTVGVCKITVSYSRPAVKGRVIWGGLVPYGYSKNEAFAQKNMPWRAGANENTTVTLSHNAVIGGKEIPAGTYGFHMLPAKEGPWTLILSKDSKAWGSYFYDESNDIVRIPATPVENQFEEYLRYGFDDVKNNSAVVYLAWERVKIGFTVSFDMDKYILKDINEQLTGSLGFNWQGYNSAAQWTLRFPAYLKQGEEWARVSISRTENSTNRNTLAYILLKREKTDEAMTLFKENVEKFPNDWNVFDSYAEALATTGNKADALKYYKLALEKAPANQKERLQNKIKELN